MAPSPSWKEVEPDKSAWAASVRAASTIFGDRSMPTAEAAPVFRSSTVSAPGPKPSSRIVDPDNPRDCSAVSIALEVNPRPLSR